MSTRIDPRDYLALEQVLVRSVQREWAKQANVLFPPIQAAVDRGDWDTAVALVESIDLAEVGQPYKDLAYSVFRGCMDFGSQLAAGGRSLMSSIAFNELVKNVVSQWLQGLEWSATLRMQRSAMQMIADAKTATEREVVVKKARPVRPFVSFQKEGDAMLQMISALHTNRLSSWGFIAESDMRGLTTYKLNAMLDNRTSDFCRFIHGKTFQVEEARGIIELGVHAGDPNDLRSIHPWPNQSKAAMEAYRSMDTPELVANKLHVPPFHPNCRTMMVKVSSAARMKKPPIQQQEELPLGEYVSSPETFAMLNLPLTEGELETWNDYVKLNPVDMLGLLSGSSIGDLLSGEVKSSLRIDPEAGVIKLGWKHSVPGLAFQGLLQIDTFFGNLLLTKKKFKNTTPSKEAVHTSRVLGAVKTIGTAIGAEQVIVSVPRGQALWYLREGYVPESNEWLTARFHLQKRIETTMKTQFEALPATTQTDLMRIVSSNYEEQVLSLLKIDLPPKFLSDLMRELEYSAILAL